MPPGTHPWRARCAGRLFDDAMHAEQRGWWCPTRGASAASGVHRKGGWVHAKRTGLQLGHSNPSLLLDSPPHSTFATGVTLDGLRTFACASY